MLEPQTLAFLSGLSQNNNKPWFDAHRAQYEAARIDFQNFIQLVINDLGTERRQLSPGCRRATACSASTATSVFGRQNTSTKWLSAPASSARERNLLMRVLFSPGAGRSFAGGGCGCPNQQR
jgi:uncharacterized protein (DUF2461 family)